MVADTHAIIGRSGGLNLLIGKQLHMDGPNNVLCDRWAAWTFVIGQQLIYHEYTK